MLSSIIIPSHLATLALSLSPPIPQLTGSMVGLRPAFANYSSLFSLRVELSRKAGLSCSVPWSWGDKELEPEVARGSSPVLCDPRGSK